MHQTHSNKVIVINKNNKNSKNFYSDALITNIKGYALGVVTADCVPIILCDSKNKYNRMHSCWMERSFFRNNRKHNKKV